MAAKTETLVNRVMKSNPESLRVARPFTFRGVTWYGFTNGKYILACKNSFGYKLADGGVNLAKIFSELPDVDSEINVTRDDVLAFKKAHSKRDKIPYIVPKDGYVVGLDPYYLLDCLDWVNNGELVYKKHLDSDKYSHITPLMMMSYDEERMAIILPVKIKRKDGAENG